jgi:hypothetical protein
MIAMNHWDTILRAAGDLIYVAGAVLTLIAATVNRRCRPNRRNRTD